MQNAILWHSALPKLASACLSPPCIPGFSKPQDSAGSPGHITCTHASSMLFPQPEMPSPFSILWEILVSFSNKLLLPSSPLQVMVSHPSVKPQTVESAFSPLSLIPCIPISDLSSNTVASNFKTARICQLPTTHFCREFA